MKRGYVLKVYPNDKQNAYFLKSFDASRKAWNSVLGMQKDRYKNNKEAKYLGYCQTAILMPLFKKEHKWLKETDSNALIAPLKKLDIAWQNFFKDKTHKYGKPRFHSRYNGKQSFGGATTNQNVKVVGKHKVQLPKIGIIKTSNTDIVKDMEIKNYSVTKRPDGNIYLSLQGNLPDKKKQPQTNKLVGIDVGLKDLFITSDGQKVSLLDVADLEEKAKYYQRKSSRERHLAKIKVRQDENAGHNTDSPLLPPRDLTSFKNWQRNRQKAARAKQKIANKRKHYYDCLTKDLVSKYDLIVLENLKIQNMVKNHNLARAIESANWYKFRTMLAYKCEEAGKKLILVDPKNTSRICSACGKKNKEFDKLSQAQWLGVREWDCPYCHAHHDRDVNAAKNILKRGQEQLAV